jgi:hypothetical protein
MPLEAPVEEDKLSGQYYETETISSTCDEYNLVLASVGISQQLIIRHSRHCVRVTIANW